MKEIDIIIPMHNAAGRIEETAKALLNQKLEDGYRQRLVVVDDASTDDSLSEIRSCPPDSVSVVCHKKVIGRAAARNSGARACYGEFLVFIDSDCQPKDFHTIMNHIRVLEAGYDVSIGIVEKLGDSFWAKYQNSLNSRGLAESPSVASIALRTANFAIRRELFENCGGFDCRYQKYGFEDKDLAARLVKQGVRIFYNADASVLHDDEPSVRSISSKMLEAGEFTAGIFVTDHPQEYEKLPYSLFDFRCNSAWRSYVLTVLWSSHPLCVRLLERIINVEWIPYHLKAMLLRIVSALSFFQGTKRAWLRDRDTS